MSDVRELPRVKTLGRSECHLPRDVHLIACHVPLWERVEEKDPIEGELALAQGGG
jgi:hypothetical protein